MIKQYRKKPVVIEAMQYTGKNGRAIQGWSDNKVIESDPSGTYVQCDTLEGVMIGNVNDFIIKGVAGEFYPCKPDIFEKTYEEIIEPNSN